MAAFSKINSGYIVILVLSNLLAFQFTRFYYFKESLDAKAADELVNPSLRSSGSNTNINSYYSAFAIPEGEAVALPSVLISKEENKEVDRTIYGGENDKKHLGGFTELDIHGISPYVWKMMIQYFGVKSVLDVGCGRGISTSWFDLHGVNVTCVEGSHDAVTRSVLPRPDTQIVEHDFSRGPWWPHKTVDAVWCVEFLEHVGRNFHANYVPAFRKAAFIFASHSKWGGWHHVEVHEGDWWIAKMQSYGFVYSEALTVKVRNKAQQERKDAIVSPNGANYNAQHVWLTMQVFINPVVASLPEHQHLFAEGGCFVSRGAGELITRECDGVKDKVESVLPKKYLTLDITDEMDREWEELVKRNIPPPEKR